MNKIDAVVYKSNTGFSRDYAQLLAEKLKVEAFSLVGTKGVLPHTSHVIFVGPLTAGKISGLRKARKKFLVEVICAVGMAFPSEKMYEDTKAANDYRGEKLYYLQGGYDPKKVGFVKHKMVSMIGKRIERQEVLTQEDRDIIDLIRNGGSYVNPKKLDEIVEYCNLEL